jgi:hypothetical protein
MIGFCGSQMRAADFQASITRAARQAAAPASAPAVANPYAWAAAGLMGGGAALVIVGLTRKTERFCNGVPAALSSQLGFPPVSCTDTTHGKPALMVAGVAALSVGGVLLAMGERQRSSVAVTAGGIAFRHRVSF